jgi:hypothetical protein
MSDPSGADRGVSEVVGVVVLFGMVMAGVALVFLTGSAVSDGVSERNQLRAAEQGLQEFDARATSLSNGADASSVAMGDNIEGAATVDRDDELRVVVEGASACSTTVPLDVYSYRLDEGGSVAYQAGAVWRTEGEETRIVSPPDLNYRNGSVSITAVELRGQYDDDVRLRKNVSRTHEQTAQAKADLFEDPACHRPDSVRLEVDSDEYHDGWYTYFQREMPDAATVTHDPSAGTVTVELPQGTLAERADDQRNTVVDFRVDNPLGKTTDADGDGREELVVDKPDDDNEYTARVEPLGSYATSVETDSTTVPITETKEVTSPAYETQEVPMKLWIQPDGNGPVHPLTNPWHFVMKYDQPLEGFEPPVYVAVFADNVNWHHTWTQPPAVPTRRARDGFTIVDRPGDDYDRVKPHLASAPEPTNDGIFVYKAGCDASKVKWIDEEAGYSNKYFLGEGADRVVIENDEDMQPSIPGNPHKNGEIITLPDGDACTEDGRQLNHTKEEFTGYETTEKEVVTGHKTVTTHRVVSKPVEMRASTSSTDQSLARGSSPIERAVNYRADLDEYPDQPDYDPIGFPVEDGESVNLTGKLYDCSESQYRIVATKTHGGTTYNYTRCDGVSGSATPPSDFSVYTDGDAVPPDSSPAWEQSLADIVAPKYTDGSGNFDLDSNQAVVVLEFDTDGDGSTERNNVVLFEMGAATSEVTADWVVDLQIHSVAAESE